jgi:hypothetical protein
MQYFYILSLAILLFSTAHAGKGKFKTSKKPQSHVNQNTHQSINTATYDSGVALPVDDVGDLPVARAIIDTAPSQAVKEDPTSAINQYNVKSMITPFNTICSDDKYWTRRIQGCCIESDLVRRLVSIDDIEYKANTFCVKSYSTKSTNFMFLNDNIGNGDFMVKFESMSAKEEFEFLFTQFCRHAKSNRYTVAGQSDMSRYDILSVKGIISSVN